MKSNLIILIILFALFSCSKKAEKKQGKIDENVNNETPKEIKVDSDTIVALKFINEYCEFCNKQFKKETAISTKEFIEKNELLTPNFKNTYKELVETAEKEDPELGLDFDPIFDAQDFPEKGFELFSIEKNGFLTVKAKGSEWSYFKVKLKIINLEGKWFVDGAGVINIAKNLREKR